MLDATLDPPVAAKPTDTTLRADAETARAIRTAASARDMTVSEYLRAFVLPIVRRDLASATEAITREDEPPAEPPARKSRKPSR